MQTSHEQRHEFSSPPMGVSALLRIEAAGVFAAALWAYQTLPSSWLLFAWIFLLPDLSLLAYVFGAKAGATAYNSAHSYLGALGLGACGLALDSTLTQSVALVWVAHIAFDRAMGYGLKHAQGFRFTHLGVLPQFRWQTKRGTAIHAAEGVKDPSSAQRP